MPKSKAWDKGAITTLADGLKGVIINSTKDVVETTKKGDSAGPIAELPKASLQPMAEIMAATSGSGTYLQATATTAESIKMVLASHKKTIEETGKHVLDSKSETPQAMVEEAALLAKELQRSIEQVLSKQDKPNAVQIISDSSARINAPSLSMGGDAVSISGKHLQTSSNVSSNTARCKIDWNEASFTTSKFCHGNYEVCATVASTLTSSGGLSTQYFDRVNTDAATSIALTTKDIVTNASSSIKDMAGEISSQAINEYFTQAGTQHILTVGVGTAKGDPPHFFLGMIGGMVAQKVLKVGLSKLGGGLLGNLVGTPTPGVVIKHTPEGSSYVTPKVTNLIGSETTNITGMARRVVHGEAVNVANKLLADVSKGIKLEGVAGGVLTMISKKFSISMRGWMGDLLNKVIGEVTDCMEFPELPKLPEITLPRVPQISCIPPISKSGEGTMKKPPTATKEGTEVDEPSDSSVHEEGVHSARYPIWLSHDVPSASGKIPGSSTAPNTPNGVPGGVASNIEGVSGTGNSVKPSYASQNVGNVTFGAALGIFSNRCPQPDGIPNPAPSGPTHKKEDGTAGKLPTNTSPIHKAKPLTIKHEMVQAGVSKEGQDILSKHLEGSITKDEAIAMASDIGDNISPYIGRDDYPITQADRLGVGGILRGRPHTSIPDVIKLLTSGKSMGVEDVLELVMGKIPEVKRGELSVARAMHDLGLGKVMNKDGSIDIANVLSVAMDRAGLKLPEGVLKVDKGTVSIDLDKQVDKAIDKAVSFLGDMDPLLKVDKILKTIGMGTPLTDLLNDLSACAKSWINIRAALKLPTIKTGINISKDILKGWSLCGKDKGKKKPLLWDGVKPGQGGYTGSDNTSGTA